MFGLATAILAVVVVSVVSREVSEDQTVVVQCTATGFIKLDPAEKRASPLRPNLEVELNDKLRGCLFDAVDAYSCGYLLPNQEHWAVVASTVDCLNAAFPNSYYGSRASKCIQQSHSESIRAQYVGLLREASNSCTTEVKADKTLLCADGTTEQHVQEKLAECQDGKMRVIQKKPEHQKLLTPKSPLYASESERWIIRRRLACLPNVAQSVLQNRNCPGANTAKQQQPSLVPVVGGTWLIPPAVMPL